MIDSHSHIHDQKFNKDREEVIQRAFDGGLEAIVSVGTNEQTSREAIELAEKYGNIYATVGLHPLHLFVETAGVEDGGVEKFDYDKYLELAENKEAVAIGEVGLDYHHFDTVNINNNSTDIGIEDIKKEQRRVLREFIKICNEVDKPIVIHCWDGYDDLLNILKEKSVKKRGVIHSFIGSWKTAQKFIELGFKIGLNGIVTYGESYDKLIRNINLKDILIETDAPYLPPKPLSREIRCEPKDAMLVAQKIAEVKNIKVKKATAIVSENSKKLFEI